jgi:hypothetical protein
MEVKRNKVVPVLNSLTGAGAFFCPDDASHSLALACFSVFYTLPFFSLFPLIQPKTYL